MPSSSNAPDPAVAAAAAGAPGPRPLFLMSRPRDDWGLRGRANVFAANAVNAVNANSAVTNSAVANSAAAADLARQAQRDWDVVKAAIEDAGGDVVVVANDDAALTGLAYTAEAGFVGVEAGDGEDGGGPVFVLPTLTPPHRHNEPAVIGPFVEARGLRTVSLGGVAFEGQGDVIDVGVSDEARRFVCTSGVGRWARTSVDAYDAYRRYLPGPSVHLRFHADPWFHGNTFLGAFRGAFGHRARVVVVACAEAFVDDGFADLVEFVGAAAHVVRITPEQTLTYATNALQVNTTVLAPAGVPDVVVDAWRGLGLTVRLLALPALFHKGGGAAVCLTNRLWGLRLSSTGQLVPA